MPSNRSNTNLSFMQASKGNISALRYEGYASNEHMSLLDKSSLGGASSVDDIHSNRGDGKSLLFERERANSSQVAMKIENRNFSVYQSPEILHNGGSLTKLNSVEKLVVPDTYIR